MAIGNSPGREGEKLQPYPGLHLYPSHQPHPMQTPLRDDAKEDNDFIAAYHSKNKQQCICFNQKNNL